VSGVIFKASIVLGNFPGECLKWWCYRWIKRYNRFKYLLDL